MSLLNQTPRARLVDAANRPYVLWDVDLTLEEFGRRLCAPDPVVRAYWLAKAMRQARPDDVLLGARSARGCSTAGARPISVGSLSPLQARVLALLADCQWTRRSAGFWTRPA